ncbi:hypothetical protein BO70DRAFT_388100 [Aspergillus heteromorphus CBS 117.55]|uniref:Uncharacterized protein n=1 Tax=Aspergillus heteromorphus CBS 117.55 TaxID=1448321 RepID=A0A317VV52_9EURO|nr:uncharacterized protein BO70DRAFT_388100 [Aspergillus heteromorphus CBS 117.55]PWY78266.1 hypothetical protein BO70DRAFT_388100 [Aspergillus heteromorphus CBS 117.55]
MDPTTKPNLTTNDSAIVESLKARELAIIRTLQPSSESSAPSLPAIQQALDDLSALITEYPTYPSAYANRAQTLRLFIDSTTSSVSSPENNGAGNGEEDPLFFPQNTSQSSTLLSDLGQAISLATPRSPADPISDVQARLLSDVHTHRGYLLLKAARVRKEMMKKDGAGVEVEMEVEAAGPTQLRRLSSDQLEDMASRDFFFGGRYGNKVAQQLAVQTNPYAKMCGAIVKEALRKEVVVEQVVKF